MNQARGRDTVSSPFQVLEVTVSLTEMGLLAWEDVAASVFAFTAMLREDGVPTHFMNEVVRVDAHLAQNMNLSCKDG